ncbi:hydrolase [Sphingomonas sp. SORGH_AS_0879]|uniref:hydrolase n=1 Tax=Sphingomonas sp. SORGH_AS_0879 TaxID=3041790 RepID=UPI00277D1856|nr:hydrolase [Sphingomonas sp. SORGH_AS_0879]MDQ1229120.1 nicotinamidase-related amidase [Sphingomonas sp. SORGH_AS_0879]
MTTLDPQTTALILIDLQQGIVPHAGGPRSGEEVVRTARMLADRFRAAGALVVLVHVGFTAEAMPSQNVDRPSLPAQGTPPDFSELVPDLRQPGDIVVLKHHWGAFTGTDLDLQLRRRGVRTVVIAGISTNMGVESTARSAWELSYDVVIAEDACASRSAELHAFAIAQIFPLIARVVASGDIALDG